LRAQRPRKALPRGRLWTIGCKIAENADGRWKIEDGQWARGSTALPQTEINSCPFVSTCSRFIGVRGEDFLFPSFPSVKMYGPALRSLRLLAAKKFLDFTLKTDAPAVRPYLCAFCGVHLNSSPILIPKTVPVTVLTCFDKRTEIVLPLRRPKLTTALKPSLPLEAGGFNCS